MAADQRYCLHCGERRTPMSSVLLGVPAASTGAEPDTPPRPPGVPPADATAQRSSALTVISGVGVLLLAMGTGVLIGRSGATRTVTVSQPVLTVPGAAGATAPGVSASEAFSDDWPAGTSGYTVELQTLPQAGTAVSAVQATKARAAAKGAKSVGALVSDDFSSLTPGRYVIYSGVYQTKGEAQRALPPLAKSFPGAKVIAVSNDGSGAGGGTARGRGASGASGKAGSGASGGAGSGTLSHPAAAPSEGAHKTKGKSFEERSKNLPNVVQTG
jgi:hypothetical protein